MKTLQVPDTVLIERYLTGDESAVEVLVTRHRDSAYRYAFRLAGDPDLAADIVAEAFLRICRSLHRFRGQCAFTTWLYRILTNCFIDSKKRKSNSFATMSLDSSYFTDQDSPEEKVLSVDPTAHTQAEQNEIRKRLIASIAALPDNYRAVIVMCYCEQMSYEEVSEALGAPVGTIKSRLNRGRLMLFKKLKVDRSLYSPAYAATA